MSGEAQEFIAYKRTKKSSWIYDEYSEQIDMAIDEIAPNKGNFCKLRLIDKEAYQKAVSALKIIAECNHTVGNKLSDHAFMTLRELGEG